MFINMPNKNWIRNTGEGVEQLIEVIFIHKYHENNLKEMEHFWEIYLAGELYAIVSHDNNKEYDFRQHLYNSFS